MTWGWLKPKMNESTVYILFCPYVCQQEAARWTVRATSHRVDPPTFPSPHLEGSLPSFIHTKSHTRTVLTRLGLFLHSLFGDHISSLPHMQCEAACHCSICVLLPLSIWVTAGWDDWSEVPGFCPNVFPSSLTQKKCQTWGWQEKARGNRGIKGAKMLL